MSSDRVTDASALSPLQALERIRRIVKDEDLTPSEKLAVIAVVLHANTKTGLAFPGQRTIRRETGIGGKPVESALACPGPGESRPRGKAVGQHIEPAGRGRHGVRVWRVLPASPVGARYENGSDPQAGALDSTQRASGAAQRASPEIQRSPEGRRTGVELKATGGEEKAPPPIAPMSGNGNGNGQALGARLKTLAVRPATADEWGATVQEDLRHGRYVRADLEAYLAGVGRIACWPRELVKDVRAFTAAAKAAAFRERLRTIRADGLMWATGPDGPGRVVYVDPDRPLLVIEQPSPAVPGSSYGPGKKRWDMTTPADLAGWRFRPDQPVLFDEGAGVGGESAGRMRGPAAEAAPAPDDFAERAAALKAVAGV